MCEINVDTNFTLCPAFTDGQQFWEQPQPEAPKNTKSWRPPHKQGKAVNIELAAYALQVKTERSGPASAIPILRWLSAQRNSNGGFSSTQVIPAPNME